LLDGLFGAIEQAGEGEDIVDAGAERFAAESLGAAPVREIFAR